MINITLKDGTIMQVENGATCLDVAKQISAGLARAALAAEVDGQTVDLKTPLEKDCTMSVLTFDDDMGKWTLRHTASHVLAQAVKHLYPDVKLAIGPAIDNGFYYDIDSEHNFTPEDLEKIEAEMKKIVKQGIPMIREEISREDALTLFREKNEPYKVELIEDLPEGELITLYHQGDFTDLCAGPHLMSTKTVKAIKLTSVAGAYWRGSEKNKMLSRIYGTAYPKASELDAYLTMMEEARKRDHRKLGKELGLFMMSDAGPGFPFFLPKGMVLKNTLLDYWRELHKKAGYVEVSTPIILSRHLWETSGHWDHYKDGMFVLGDEEQDNEVMALRPMTCPFQFTVYNAEQHSYRDLPIRYAETSTLFRKEASGEMHGLIRVRQFTLSEGHIICTPEQLESEFKEVIDLINYVMSTLGIDGDISYRFSKWDPSNTEKYINNPEAWEATQNQMRTILDHLGIDYVEAEGEAAFYGPKLDIQAKNVHGKEDTIITVQIDFALGERLGMSYIDKDGNKKIPFVIHRSSIGCYERTIATLIEKYAGAFPTWMSPVQAKVLPLSDKYAEYADEVVKTLRKNGVRVEVDHRVEKIGYKIREARLERVPYILVVGEKEAANNEVSVRSRKNDDEGAIALDAFVSRITTEIANKERQFYKIN